MSSAGQPYSAQIALPPEQFAATFPFHIALDRNLKLVQAGSTLRRICPDVHPGASLDQIFRPSQPQGQISFNWVMENRLRFFLLEHLATKLLLRGEFMLLPSGDTLLFLGSPWFADSSEIAHFGLRFEDFAIHDPVVDMLQVFQASRMALADAKKLAAKLSAQRAELRATNERLRQQEVDTRKLALIAARTDNAVVLTDAEGSTVWVNEGFTRLTGYTLDEMLGKKPGQVLQGPGTDPETVQLIGERLRRGEGFSVEILNYGKHGRTYWLAVEVQPIHDDHGRLTNFMAIESDITERRAAQRRLAIQFEVSRALAEARSFEAAIQAVLKVMCENLGWQVGELWRLQNERLRCVEIWHPPSVQVPNFVAASRSIEFARGVGLPGRVWAEAQPAWIPDVTRDANFPRRTVAAQEGLRGAFGFPVFARGELWGVVDFFSRKIEEPDAMLLKTFSAVGNQIGQFIVRREAEEALRETSTLQQAILEGANYSIISTAPDGLIRTFNSAAQRMLGYRSEEVVGKVSPGIFHDLDEVTARSTELTLELGRKIEPGFEAFVAKATLGKPDEREWTYIRKDGSRFPVRLSVTALFDESAAVVGYLGIASDITESKRIARELLEAKESAEAASRAKSDFLSMMSHEIRTPMNAVIGMTDLLLETNLTRLQREFASAVAQSANALLHVIDDVLDFSKIEAGKLTVVSEEFEMRPVVDSVMEVVSHREPAKGITLAGIVQHDTPTRLRGDPMRLRQILINLLGNAVKFTEKGDVVLRVWPVATLAQALRLRFEVTDSGVGLTAGQIRELFQPFVQADSSSSRRYGGTGLGLAISRRLVELLGGEIGVKSIPNLGSTFWFEMPFGLAAQPASDYSQLQLARVHAIVAAKHLIVRESLQEQFSTWGISCKSAASADELSAILAAEAGAAKVLFVLCDDCLLAEGGGALSEQLRGLRGKAHTLLLSSPATVLAQDQNDLSLFENVLLKPVKQSPLFDALVTAIEGRNPTTAQKEIAADFTRPSGHAPGGGQPSNLSILLAEDHAINRKLCLLMLEGLGTTADVATNGVEVLAAVGRKRYDLILMDCNMPEMDGYQAATAVRKFETSSSEAEGRRIRIVALTANAQIGERERCLAAGMDDYLTKPFTSRQLREVLSSITPILGHEVFRRTEFGLNSVSLTQLCSELDAPVVYTMVRDFLKELPERFAELRQFAENRNWVEAERGAHSLKGVSASFGFELLSEKLRALEKAAGYGDGGAAHQLLVELKPMVKGAADAFGGWLEKRQESADPEI